MRNKHFIAVFLTVIFLMLAAGCDSHGTKMDYNGSELYYTKNTTEADAKKLGDYLVKTGYFGKQQSSVQLDKSGSTFQARYVVAKGAADNAEIVEGFKIIAEDLSHEVFNNAPTEIHLCDEDFKTIKVVKP